MEPKVLFIANTSENFAIGSIFSRAAKSMGLTFTASDTAISNYAPSLKTITGRIFNRLAGKRALEWWSFNRKIVTLIKEFQPNIVIVTGVFPLKNEVFQASHQVNAKIVNYLTDSPWSPQNYCRAFVANLSNYDYIFSTKKAIIPELIAARVKKVSFLPFAFDPFMHHKVESCEINYFPDVCIIGGTDRERLKFVKSFLTTFKGTLGLYGGYWYKEKQLKPLDRGAVYGEDYCRTIGNCKINVGLIRRANRDGHSMRSFEIPACGGVGIYEDTPEHRELFQAYPEYGFFSSFDDLAEKCNWLLEHPEELEKMRKLGIGFIVNEANTYTDRLKKILELLE